MRRIGRYALFDAVGHGGTATVHLGRLLGPAGFSKIVAIKRMHESVSRDSDVAAMFLDEARISARIRHPNVVAATDFLAIDDETFLVMEYVHGESLSVLNEGLRSRGQRMPAPIAVHVLRDVLHGLHAAHETSDEEGRPLSLVHRDVSPQNVQVGVDGAARVLDFGIAKALGRLQDTHTGQVKGKLSYMAPEQLLGQPLDRRVDVFAAGVVLWETLAGRRLFAGDNPGQVVQRVLSEEVPRLDTLVGGLSPRLVAAVARATQREARARFATALDFARELESAAELVPAREVGEWLKLHAGERLARRTERLREIERIKVGPASAPMPTLPERPPSEPAGPDDATRSEFHVRLSPDDTGRTPQRVKPWLSPRRAALVGSAALLGALAAFVTMDGPRPADQIGTAQGGPVAPEAVVVRQPPAPPPEPARAPEPERPAAEALEKPSAERPRRLTARAAKPRPAKAPQPERATAKPAANPSEPKVVRRAEDLFSRN